MNSLHLLAFYLFFFFGVNAQEAKHHITLFSPNKKLELKINEAINGNLLYSFRADGKLLISESKIGLDTLNARWAKTNFFSVNKVWKPLWGKRKIVPDVYNEAQIDLGFYKLVARVYNEGVAFCYKGLSTKKELTQFNFAGNFTAWYYNGENHNLGPEKLLNATGLRKPVMTIKADQKHYLAIHEAALESGEPLLLQAQNNGSTIFSVSSKHAKAWRVILYGKTAGELVDSHLIELLNPDPEDGTDFSWVKPSVAVWDWRINGAVANGFKYDMSLPSWKKMIDFAAQNGMGALVLDADWYGPEFAKGSDPLKGGKVEQVRQAIAYGKQKGVGLWLYLNDVGAKNFPLAQTLKQYGDWGAVGLKYGFMQGTPEEKNIHTQLITKLCAQNKLMVDFHDGPVHPYGQMRTWPNAVTREFCHSQLDAKRVFEPKTFVTTVFVNMLSGPIDMDNGIMDMQQLGRVDNPMAVPSTITAEAARTLITFSGATIIPDIPENYIKHPDLLKFISAQQMPWQESKTISGEIGEYIVMARKAADNKWLIAAATNENSRKIKIPLSILEKGTYEALIIQDGKDANFRTNKESYMTSTQNVNQNQSIEVQLAPGGGACILLQKIK